MTEEMQETIEKKSFEKFYNRIYLILLIIPVLLLILSLIYLYSFSQQHGDLIRKDITLTGGTSIQVNSDIDITELRNTLNENFEDVSEEWIDKETIEPTDAIPTKVFVGFKRACHKFYKFQSKTEKDFAIILENDKEAVVRWMRPAQAQFSIYWNRNENRYQPDFIVESKDTIYMVETKKEGDIETQEVQEKAKAALWYCKHASEYTSKNSGKPWKYVLIPHDKVQLNMSFKHLVEQYVYRG